MTPSEIAADLVLMDGFQRALRVLASPKREKWCVCTHGLAYHGHDELHRLACHAKMSCRCRHFQEAP